MHDSQGRTRKRVAVLTFDDGNKSDHSTVAPILERFGFGATFFITEGLGFLENKRSFLTWGEIVELHAAGFEIGNHTRQHLSVREQSRAEIHAELEHIEKRCEEHGLPRPTTFAYPGYQLSRTALEVVQARGYRFARRGVDPEYAMRHDKQGEENFGLGRPRAWDPEVHHPLLVPTTVDAGLHWTRARFRRVISGVPPGMVPILTFHGVPALEHPWNTIDPAEFLDYMTILRDEGFSGVPLRDLASLGGATAPDATTASDATTADLVVDPIAAMTARRHVVPTELRTGGARDPIGIGEPRPILSWTPVSSRRGQTQRAAQVLASSSPALLAQDVGDLWDSGRVRLAGSVGLRYAGRPLASGERCCWKVRLWDGSGMASGFGPPAVFEMGLLDPSDWGGDWIAAKADVSAPLIRTTFGLAGPVRRARAYVLGLGYHELHLNGTKVDDRVLDPAPTFYDDGLVRDLGLGPVPRTKYSTYDVTEHLTAGANGIGVMLGNGWFSREPDVPRSPYHRDPYSDRPVLRVELRIELASGETISVTSGPGWRTASGPVRYNDYCHGEEYDARLESPGWDRPDFDDAEWTPVEVVPGPSGPPSAQRTEVTRVIQTRMATEVDRDPDGRRIFDLGQNLTGWARIRVDGKAGAAVTLRHAARLRPDGRLDTDSNEADGCTSRQTDTYILRGGEPEQWEPRFTLHGFRYIEVTTSGDCSLEHIEGRVVHSDVEPTGSFTTSDPLLDRLHSNTQWSLRSGFQGFLQPTGDRCERLGWLGDPGFLAGDMFFDFDLASFWADWLDDIKDAQMPDGALPITAPPHWHAPWGGRPNDFAYQPWPDWMATYPILVWQHHRFYADAVLVERHFEAMKRLVDWMAAQAPDLIMPIGLGDHMEPQPDGLSSHSPKNTPVDLTSTAWFYASTAIVARSAAVLGRAADADSYGRLASAIRRAFNRRFFDRKLGRYGTGSQTANVLPLELGMVPRGREQDVTADIVADIRRRENHLATGIMGTPALGRALPEHGAADAMLDVMSQTTYPSWGHQIAMGATTGWETWGDDPPGMSLNMWMFAASPTFLYRDVAGIAPASAGWRDITFRPRLSHRLDHARAQVGTPRGEGSVEWERDGVELRVHLEVPSTSRGDVWLPTGDDERVIVYEGDVAIWRDGDEMQARPGIGRASRGSDHLRLQVGGGSYFFRVRPLTDPGRSFAEWQ